MTWKYFCKISNIDIILVSEVFRYFYKCSNANTQKHMMFFYNICYKLLKMNVDGGCVQGLGACARDVIRGEDGKLRLEFGISRSHDQ